MAESAGPVFAARLVDRLVLAGSVERTRCETDRRGLNAQLTEAGEARFAEARPTHLAGDWTYALSVPAAEVARGLWPDAAVREIHGRIRQVRERQGAVLLISEDLDELLALADRIVVMSEGRIVHDVPAANADRRELGAFMGGKGHGPAHAAPTPEAA